MSSGMDTLDPYINDTRFALMEQSMNHMNQKLDSSILQMNQTLLRFEARFDKLDNEIKEVYKELKKDVNDVQKELKSEIRNNFFWTLGVIGAVLAVVAHGFHWL